MRIIDYYNYAAIAVYIVIMVAAFFLGIIKKNGLSTIKSEGSEGKVLSVGKRKFLSGKTAALLFTLIMIIAAAIRLIGLDAVPYGLQQDEASIGYDAYCLATYGIENCNVVAACHIAVSGTGALTGIIIAYEAATGNELDGAAVADFSKKLNIKALYEYCKAVMDSTNTLLAGLKFSVKRIVRVLQNP